MGDQYWCLPSFNSNVDLAAKEEDHLTSWTRPTKQEPPSTPPLCSEFNFNFQPM